MKKYTFIIALLISFFAFRALAKDTIDFSKLEKIRPLEAKEFQFKLKDAETRQIRLHLEARFDWKCLGGYTTGMQVFVNGRKVPGARLLNKPLKFKTRNGSTSKWGSPESNSYVLMYSGDFSNSITTNKHYIYSLIEKNQHPYKFVFDLSGLAQHVGKNTIKINAAINKGVVIRNVRLEIDKKKMPRINDPAALVQPAPTGPLKVFTPKGRADIAYDVSVTENGAMSIKVNQQRFILNSKFSIPKGKWLYFKGGIPKGKITKEKAFVFVKNTPDYKIERKILVKKDHIKVFDKFTNFKKRVTGIMFENTMLLPEKPEKVLRRGTESNIAKISSNTHPVVCAFMKTKLAALLAEDDIFRSQNYLSKKLGTITLGNKSLGLPPMESHTLEWSIYILPGNDYFDLVNAIRRNWNANFTWHGPLAFPRSKRIVDWNVKNVTPAFVKKYLKKYPVKLVMTHVATSARISRKNSTIEKPWIGHGTAIPSFSWWCGRTKALVKVMKEVAPDVEVYAYMHKNLCSEPGYPSKYRDSVALQTNSSKLGLFVPTLNNSYGKALTNVYKFIVEELGANIYMDEICLGVTNWGPYKEWDNCTVEISRSSHKVVRKLSIPNLLVKPWLESMINYLQQNGKKLLANGPPATRTLQHHHLEQFVEEGMGESGLIAAQLSTPLAWNGYTLGIPGYRLTRNSLDFGALAICWSGKWSEHLFPFSPIELHKGYIIGKERIVTNRSGRFGWNDSSLADVYVYNGKGNLCVSPDVKTVKSNGKVFIEVRMPSDHLAVLVRKTDNH